MKQIFDPSKPVQTRDGCPARIVCGDALGCGDKPILALVTRGNHEVNIRYGVDGRANRDALHDSDSDLVNVSEKVNTVLFVNIYPDGSSNAYDTQWYANLRSEGSIACFQVDIQCQQGALPTCTIKAL